MPPPMLSSMFAALLVAGVTAVIVGLDTNHLRKNCAHVVASNSLAHSGTDLFAARPEQAGTSKRRVGEHRNLLFSCERQNPFFHAAVVNGVIDADEIERFIAHEQFSNPYWLSLVVVMPTHFTRPAFLNSCAVGSCPGRSTRLCTCSTSITGFLIMASERSICARTAAGSAFPPPRPAAFTFVAQN